MARAISRRRAISIMAAASGLPLLGAKAASAAMTPVVWHGQALGAPATLILNHPDRAKAERLIDRVVAEVGRLEAIFSLYRETSTLCELNRVGGLAAPPAEFVELLEACRVAWRTSKGAFDPTVQPLWTLYARHFASSGMDPAGPALQDIEDARSRIGFDAVHFNPHRIVFTRPHMALTLNGIAQGYVTDRVVDLLKAEGVTNSLINMGESRALGPKADGASWKVKLAETEVGGGSDIIIDLVDKAVATTSSTGFHFDGAGRFGHILDPREEAVPPFNYRRVTTIAPTATIADALSTAFSLMDEASIRTTVAHDPSIIVDLVDVNGSHIQLTGAK